MMMHLHVCSKLSAWIYRDPACGASEGKVRVWSECLVMSDLACLDSESVSCGPGLTWDNQILCLVGV